MQDQIKTWGTWDIGLTDDRVEELGVKELRTEVRCLRNAALDAVNECLATAEALVERRCRRLTDGSLDAFSDSVIDLSIRNLRSTAAFLLEEMGVKHEDLPYKLADARRNFIRGEL